jgi:hypothetical protein
MMDWKRSMGVAGRLTASATLARATVIDIELAITSPSPNQQPRNRERR